MNKKKDLFKYEYCIHGGLIKVTTHAIPDPFTGSTDSRPFVTTEFQLELEKLNSLIQILKRRNEIKSNNSRGYWKRDKENGSAIAKELKAIHSQLKAYRYSSFFKLIGKGHNLTLFSNLQYFQDNRNMTKWLRVIKLEYAFRSLPLDHLEKTKRMNYITEKAKNHYYIIYRRNGKIHKDAFDKTLSKYSELSPSYFLKEVYK